MTFEQSRTCENLMRAFAGESMARNRYTIAAQAAREKKLFVLSRLFLFTAEQEKEHAELFYKRLTPVAGSSILINAAYPAEPGDDMLFHLTRARHNEAEEHLDVYPGFAAVAREEGFPAIASLFNQIALIEQIHSKRFDRFVQLLEGDRLFKEESETAWLCLNCGHIHTAKEAPGLCPVCAHDRGYFVRASESVGL